MLDQPKPNCLVLLGHHGVGKDTLCGMMQAARPGVVNAKFGALNKRFVAEMLNVGPSALEDREWRSGHNLMQTFGVPNQSLSPLDLLNVLYQGLQSSSPSADRLRAAHTAYTLQKAKEGKLAVFTDVRNEHEMLAIYTEFNPVVIYIRDNLVPPSEGDENVQSLAKSFANGELWRVPGQPLQTLAALVHLLKTLEEKNAPLQ